MVHFRRPLSCVRYQNTQFKLISEGYLMHFLSILWIRSQTGPGTHAPSQLRYLRGILLALFAQSLGRKSQSKPQRCRVVLRLCGLLCSIHGLCPLYPLMVLKMFLDPFGARTVHNSLEHLRSIPSSHPQQQLQCGEARADLRQHGCM